MRKMNVNDIETGIRSMTGRADDIACCIGVVDGHEWLEKEGKYNKNKIVYHKYRCKGISGDGEQVCFFDVKVSDVEDKMAEQVRQMIKENGTVNIEFVEFFAKAYAFVKEDKLISGVSAKAKAVLCVGDVIV